VGVVTVVGRGLAALVETEDGHVALANPGDVPGAVVVPPTGILESVYCAGMIDTGIQQAGVVADLVPHVVGEIPLRLHAISRHQWSPKSFPTR